MRSGDQSRTIRRVLVALDASRASLAAAAAAARLAAQLGAELAGLFVEDEDLITLSRSPMARLLDPLTAAVDHLEGPDVERQFRVQALRAKQALARLAEEAGVEWSFEIARGSVAAEIQAATTEGDVVSLGRVGWSFRHRRLLGRTARALLAQSGRCILLIERLGEHPSPVAVLYDGSDQANHALDIADHLAGSERGHLAILMIGPDLRLLRARLVQRLGEERVKAAAIELGEVVDSRLCQTVRSMNAGLLVVPVGIGSLGEDKIQELLNETDSPILAVS